MAAKIGYTEIMLDWKERPTVEQLNAALNRFGVYVYDDETLKRSNMYGYLFTEGKVNPRRLIERVEFDRSWHGDS